MLNRDYEPAQIAKVASSGEFICGFKIIADTWDCMTGEWWTMFIIALDSSDGD